MVAAVASLLTPGTRYAGCRNLTSHPSTSTVLFGNLASIEAVLVLMVVSVEQLRERVFQFFSDMHHVSHHLGGYLVFDPSNAVGYLRYL